MTTCTANNSESMVESVLKGGLKADAKYIYASPNNLAADSREPYTGAELIKCLTELYDHSYNGVDEDAWANEQLSACEPFSE